jgi:hypothetical protein
LILQELEVKKSLISCRREASEYSREQEEFAESERIENDGVAEGD